LEILSYTTDLYNSSIADDILGIKTFYETQYLLDGAKINYLKFRLPNSKEIYEIPEEE
jgi:tRNA (guanine-N7-)-methyltransferase